MEIFFKMSEKSSNNSLELESSPSHTTEETASIVSPTKVKKSARFMVANVAHPGEDTSRKNSQDEDLPEYHHDTHQKSHHDTNQKSHHRNDLLITYFV